MKNIIYTATLLLMSLLLSCAGQYTPESAEEKAATKSEVPEKKPAKSINDMSYLEVSQGLLSAVKSGSDATPYVQKIANANPENLKTELNTDTKKLAFWINTYNGLIQTTLKEDPKLYEDRNEFFKLDQLSVAGTATSFDEIEHGIIRSATAKLSKGYLPKVFKNDFVKEFMVDEKDGRIHFVLNCGAKDCPPVAIFDASNFDQQMDNVAGAYLKKVSTYDAGKKMVKTTPLFNWFTGDFGVGKKGVRDMLAKYQIIPADHDDIDVEYIVYDWTLELGNFTNAELSL